MTDPIADLIERCEYSRDYGEANLEHKQLMQDIITALSPVMSDEVAEHCNHIWTPGFGNEGHICALCGIDIQNEGVEVSDE